MPAPSEPSPPPDPVALADFLGRLAHDLRSPLGVITEALASIRADLAAELTDEHRLLGALADRGLMRLGHLADTVSLASALGSGKFVLRRAPLDLVELLRGATAVAFAIEVRREVTLSSDLPDGPLPVQADADRLSRAVSEIVINAVRHAYRRARLRLALAGGEAQVVVEDDGQGVPDEQRATLFRRFAPRPSRGGLGLGLSIAHDVIVAHGGRLTLEASSLPPGRPGTTGAAFVISLPLATAAPTL
jgi:signal transduction histidine kinase